MMENCEIKNTCSEDIDNTIKNLKSGSDLDSSGLELCRTKKRFRLLGQVYSKAHGSYVAWNTDVNLDTPVALGKKVPSDAKHAIEYYTALQYTLYETSYPETIDRTDTPRTEETAEGVTVTVLASPVECIGLLLEGGRQCPDAFVIILSTSWVRKVPSSDTNGSAQLYVYKGVTFARGGATFIDEYDPPRKCTYLVDFFTGCITGGQRNDGPEIERNLECPMSSSVEICAKIDDKVWTTCIMAEVGLNFPEFLAFRYCPTKSIPVVRDERIRIYTIEEKSVGYDAIAEEVETFLDQPFMANVGKIVVKPSGPMFYRSIGVSIHPRDDREQIIRAAQALLKDLEPGCSILVQAFIEPIKARYTGKGRTEFHSQKFGFRCRATMSRDFSGNPKVVMLCCGVNRKDKPIHGDNTVHQSLDSTLLSYGVTDPAERAELTSHVKSKCEALMQYIMDDEVLHQDNRRARAMTDIISIDIVIADSKDGGLTFYGIEVNSHDCIINCHVHEFVNAMVGQEPGCFKTIVQTMVTRSQKYLMEEKIVLVVGAGGYSKRNIIKDARKYGIKIILVDFNPVCRLSETVYKFINYDFTDHNLDQAHAMNIANLLRYEDLEVDGCLTFWEDCGPLAAAVAELLDTNCNSYEASSNAKQKSCTQFILIKRGDDIPHWPRTCLYVSDVHALTCWEDVADVETKVDFPCILKLEHGSSAVGVVRCESVNEIMSHYKHLTEVLSKEEDFPGIGLGFNNAMMVMNYWEGSEHDVDVVIYNRKFVTAILTDNGPTNETSFVETSACMPSQLPKDKQGQLVAAAYQCCTELGGWGKSCDVIQENPLMEGHKEQALGLENGVFNVEMKMTAWGPKLIEINARMGGFYIRDWVQRLYGIDLALAAMMISCDVKPFLFKPEVTKVIMGIMLIPSQHKRVLLDNGKLELLRTMHRNKNILFTEFAEHYGEQTDIYEEPEANIAVVCDTVDECKTKLIELCREFEMSSETYNVESIIEGF